MSKNIKGVCIGRLQLSDGVDSAGIKHVQLLRTGIFNHPNAPNGKFTIDEKILERMKNNFDNNVRRLDKSEIPLDYGHNSEGKAAGWITSVTLEDEGKSLWVDINYTAQAEESIKAREWRFISADIDFEYEDNEAGVNLGATLLGAGLVNRPHIKAMQAVFSEVNNNEKQYEEYSMTPEEMLKKIGELEGRVLELEGKLNAKGEDLKTAASELKEMEKKEEGLKEQLKEATLKVTTLTTEKETVVKEAKFSELLSAGKILPAQKEAFMEMPITLAEKFFKDSKAANFSDKGHGGAGSGNDDGEKSVDAIIEERASKLISENKNLTLSEAYSRVLSADKDLAKKYESSMQA